MTAPERTYANVVVTGASSGLGRGLAAFFVRRGSHVHAAARRAELLESLSDELQGAPGTLTPLVLDVSKGAATVERLLAVDAACGGVDLVIANAGVGEQTRGKRLKWAPFERMLEVNVLGAAATLSALVPRMVERGRGQLVGMASLAAFILPAKTWGYSASKTFVHQMCRGLRMDLRGTGVTVTCLYPGFVKSEMTANNKFQMPFLLETEDAVKRMGKAIVRGEEEFAFPWQLATLVGAAGLLPASAKEFLGRRAWG